MELQLFLIEYNPMHTSNLLLSPITFMRLCETCPFSLSLSAPRVCCTRFSFSNTSRNPSFRTTVQKHQAGKVRQTVGLGFRKGKLCRLGGMVVPNTGRVSRSRSTRQARYGRELAPNGRGYGRGNSITRMIARRRSIRQTRYGILWVRKWNPKEKRQGTVVLYGRTTSIKRQYSIGIPMEELQ